MITCKTLLKDNTYTNDLAYGIKEFIRTRPVIEQANIKKCKSQYVNYVCTFDIETSKYKITSDEHEVFMFHWQFCINGTVIFGRTWKEYKELLEFLKSYLKLDDKHKLVIYVHNLSYEFHFMYNLFKLTDKPFCIDDRKVAKCTFDKVFEYRCSYILSNMSLAKLIENTPNTTHFKAKEDFEYNVLRTPSTTLTPKEYGYCYNDVFGLYECIREYLQTDTLETIKLTSTGFIRREVKNRMDKNPKNKEKFKELAMSEVEYQACRDAFRGGNTGSNMFHTDKELTDVSSYDMTSAYPYVMISEQYPMSKWMKIKLTNSKQFRTYNKTYCTLGKYCFTNLRLKYNIPIPYIPRAKCLYFDGGENSRYCCYNGRVLYANELAIELTQVDFDIISNQYEWDKVVICDFMVAKKGYLPKELRQYIIELYEAKTQLKGVQGKEYEYAQAKARLNSLYGMLVTDIQRETVEFNPDAEDEKDLYKRGETPSIEEYYNRKSSFLSYQWGIYVTAYCRANLQKAIDEIGLDVVYCDTDSVKYLNNHDEVFEKINNDMLEHCKKNNIINYAIRDDKYYYLGVYDYEGCSDKFKTLGAKKYCGFKKDKAYCTVAGLNKKKGAKELEENGMEIFTRGYTFHDSGRTVAKYLHNKPHYILIDNESILCCCGIVILDTTYTLGMTGTMIEILERIAKSGSEGEKMQVREILTRVHKEDN